MPWYISEPASTGWKLDPKFLIIRIQQRWPKANIQEINDLDSPNFSHEWTMPMAHGDLEGRFNQNRSAVSLDGDIRDAVPFALWLRSIVPTETKLLFYDQGYSMHIDLKPETTEADILAVVGV